MIFDMFDYSCAAALEVPVSVFVDTIEKTTDYRMDVIINALLSDDKTKIAKAKKCFNLIK